MQLLTFILASRKVSIMAEISLKMARFGIESIGLKDWNSISLSFLIWSSANKAMYLLKNGLVILTGKTAEFTGQDVP